MRLGRSGQKAIDRGYQRGQEQAWQQPAPQTAQSPGAKTRGWTNPRPAMTK